MSSTFDQNTEAEAVVQAFAAQCKGKYVIVTGANTGLGEETSRALAAHGANVIMASRSLDNGKAAMERILVKHSESKVSVMQLDLGSLDSITKFADEFLARKEPLHILINNAGVMACPQTYTKDGFEMQFGVNHLGHFLLTNLLLDKLADSGSSATPARVVNLASMGNWIFAPDEGIMFDDLKGEKSYLSWQRYGQSKLANILFTNELNKRMKSAGKPVISVSLHPGSIMGTDLARHMGIMNSLTMFRQCRSGTMFAALSSKMKSIAQGSSTTIVAALDPAIIPGEYYSDCRVESEKRHPRAKDPELAQRLWQVSADLVDL